MERRVLVAGGSICPVQAAPLDWIQTERVRGFFNLAGS